MSHHLDTPLARQNGRLYIDDMYVFGSEGATTFVMDVNSTITGPDITPGFHPEGRYEFKVHFDGADVEALTYRFAFDGPDADGRPSYTVYELTGAAANDDGTPGIPVARGRTGEAAEQGSLRVWAGRVQDPFYVDLDQLDVINAAVRDGAPVDLTSWAAAGAKNSFAGTTVCSIVLEVTHDHPRLRPGASTGVWCATKLATDAGGWRQINRFGHPMMWPIFWPDDTDFANPANDRHPAEDFDADGKYIAEKVGAVVAANGTSADPQGYGALVARRLFPDVLSYMVGTPASFGINGRTLADNAPEAMFSLILGKATPSGLGPSTAADQRQDRFPYVVPG
ncbi:DUF4331 family protein [Phytohabitans sp. LJ34]|uniref:DUF4331 family protein n=1 Tax=Phytohabitans sp. LJ34 TaxID=3452217 RepID=UPI003F8A9C46